MNTKRNGEIDVLRFLCAAGIAVHHYNDLFPADLMYHGYTFVKFFFLVSGYLMVHSMTKLDPHPGSSSEIANATWAFLFRKIRSFYPYFFFAVILQLVLFLFTYGYGGFGSVTHQFLEAIPTFTLAFQGLNLTGSLYLGGSWYLSAMLVGLFLLFPVALRYRDLATKILFPLLSLFLLGYLNTTYGSVSIQFQWTGFCSSGILQAVAQMALGASLYPLAAYLRENPQWQAVAKTRLGKLVFTILKLVCYCAVFSHAQDASIGDLHALLLLALAVLLNFSDTGFAIPESRFTRYLGKASLCVYLFHGIFRYPLYNVLGYYALTPKRLLGLSAMSVLISIVLMHFVDWYMGLVRKAWKKAFAGS